VLSCAVSAVLYAGITARAVPSAIADDTLAEIVVTARKRTENVQDVPQNVDVFTAQNIKDLGIVRFEDFVALSPSISMISTGPGGQRITIRAPRTAAPRTTDSATAQPRAISSTISRWISTGMIPTCICTTSSGSRCSTGRREPCSVPGPWRVPYASSRTSPIQKPSAPALNSTGHHCGRAKNWSYQGYANIPLIEGITALRVSAFSVREGGYIDNVLATRSWVNGVTSTNAQWAGSNFNVRDILGGRIALLQNIGEDWHISVTGNYQQQNYRGSWEDDPTNVGRGKCGSSPPPAVTTTRDFWSCTSMAMWASATSSTSVVSPRRPP